MIQNPADLQSYNRYSYVRNNPLTLTDPSGWADTGNDTNPFLSWLASLYVTDTSAIPGGNAESSRQSSDPEQAAYRDGAKAGFQKGMEYVKAEGEIANVGASLIPGEQVGLHAGQAMTGQNLQGQPVSRSGEVTNLGLDLTLGMAVEGVGNKLSEIAGDVTKAIGKLIGNEGEAGASLEAAAVKTGLKDEVHGNSIQSTAEQHRYEIVQNDSGDVVKTGISGQDLNANGTSPRANSQVNRLNAAEGAGKYSANIKEKNIPGRAAGLASEKSATNKLAEDKNSLRLQRRPTPQPNGGNSPPSDSQ